MPPHPRSRSSASAARRRWSIPSASSRGCAPRATRSRKQHDGADLVVVNTCGFLDSAPATSRSRPSATAMAENGKVIVTGCLGAEPERDPRTASRTCSPITGPQAYESVMAAVHEAAPPAHDPFLDLLPPQGVKLTPRHYAYLKISEGCNNRCTFCIIPTLRGDLVSRPAGRRAARGREAGQGRRQGAPGHLAGHQRLRRRHQVPAEPVAAIARCGPNSSISPRNSASSASGCGCTMSIPIRMSTRSSR